MSKELITLFGTGSIPGIPGSHGAGTYEVDYEARTLVPFVAAPADAPDPGGDASPTAVGGNPPEEQPAPLQEAVQPTEEVPAPEEGAQAIQE